ncbi:hypothetical protein WDU94_004581 [Cyamophila willieti]
MLKLRVAKRTRHSITLEWNLLEQKEEANLRIAYFMEREDYRIRGWEPVYRRFRQFITIENLKAETCFKFRLQAFVKTDGRLSLGCSEEMYAHTADDFMSLTTFHRAIQYGDLNDIRKFVRER